MQKLWSFLGRKRNRDILAWVGGGFVVAATGLWVVFTYAYPAGKSSGGVTANCGGVAIGGNVTGSNVTAGTTAASDCSPK